MMTVHSCGRGKYEQNESLLGETIAENHTIYLR